MTRSLPIAEPQHFEILWIAYLNAPRAQGRPFDQARRDARLYDALVAVSEAPNPAKELERRLTRPETLALDQADFLQLQEYVERTPWMPAAAPKAVEVYDLLTAAEKRP